MSEQKYKELIEAQSQVLEEVVLRVESLENREYPDYRQATADIHRAVGTLSLSADDIKALVKSIPPSIPVDHLHKLEPKSKKVILLISGLAVLLICCCCWIFHLYQWNNDLFAQSLKYRAIRQAFPLQTDWADSIYRIDPDNMERTTIKLEEQAEASSHAKDIADQKAREAEGAKASARQIDKASKHAQKMAFGKNK